jgi:hypothetical protein
VIEVYYYVIDGLVFGSPGEMTSVEATERNAQLEKMRCRARWRRQHEFFWIADVEVVQ